MKLHADQLSDSGGAELAAEFEALSADHLEHASEAGIAALAEAGTVAVLLPGAYYFLRETKLPPVELLRKHGVPMAIATDCNPGTSPCTSILTMMNMACTLFRLTPEEALAGATCHAARRWASTIAARSKRGSARTSPCGTWTTPCTSRGRSPAFVRARSSSKADFVRNRSHVHAGKGRSPRAARLNTDERGQKSPPRVSTQGRRMS